MEENNLQILNAIKDSTNKIIEEIRVNSNFISKEIQLNSIDFDKISKRRQNIITQLKEQYYELREQNKYEEAQEKMVNIMENANIIEEPLNVSINPIYQVTEQSLMYNKIEVNGTITNNDSKNLENIIVHINIYSCVDNSRIDFIRFVYDDRLGARETAQLRGWKLINKSSMPKSNIRYEVEIARYLYE